MQRRDFLKASAALAAAGFPAQSLFAAAAATSPLQFLGKPQAFDTAWLKGYARQLAAQPYRAPENHIPDEVAKLDWDQYQAINYRDVATFLGASYFRAVGSDWQYGLSARGLAIDCGM